MDASKNGRFGAGRTCGRHLAEWRKILKHHPEAVLVRDIPSGLCWCNESARRSIGLPEELDKWDHVMRWAAVGSVKTIEDAHSLTLKTGRIVTFVAHARIELAEFTPVANAVMAVRCGGCEKCCAAVVITVQPVDGAVEMPGVSGHQPA